jgi:hypothetical protein
MRQLTAEDVVQYFRSLSKQQLRNNPALTEAGRASTRLKKTHVAGPGRPPTLEHRPVPPRPSNWPALSQGEKAAWTRKNHAYCRCAACRRANFPSYRHEPYGG